MNKLRTKVYLIILLVALCVFVGCTCNVAGGKAYLNCFGDVIPCVSSTSDLGSLSKPFDEAFINTIHSDEVVLNAFKDNYLVILDDFKDWGKTIVNSGSSNDAPVRATVFTGVAPLSSCLRYAEIAPMRYGDAPARINWGKKLIWIFSIVRINSDAEFIGRMQIKEGVAIGQLVADGVGIQIDNYNLTGEAYGAAGRDTVALTTVLGSSFCYGVMIVHNPGVNDQFWIDSGNGWVLEGTIVDTTRIPSGLAGGWDYVIVSAENGVTGGVNNEMSIYKPYVWSKK